jgi:hypothetical protein
VANFVISSGKKKSLLNRLRYMDALQERLIPAATVQNANGTHPGFFKIHAAPTIGSTSAMMPRYAWALIEVTIVQNAGAIVNPNATKIGTILCFTVVMLANPINKPTTVIWAMIRG